MADSYDELDCQHSIGECYTVGEIHSDDGLIGGVEVAGSISPISGPKLSSKAKWNVDALSTDDNIDFLVIPGVDPDEANVIGCNDSDCDEYHVNKLDKYKDYRTSINHTNSNKNEDSMRLVDSGLAVRPSDYIDLSALPDVNEPDTNLDDNPTRITIDPTEQPGDPYQQSHAIDRSTSLDSENETDSNQAEVDNPTVTTPTTDESTESETNDGESPSIDEGQDGDSSPARAETPEATTIRASSDDDIGMSFGDEGVSLAFGDSQSDTDGTTVQVSADKDLDFSTDGGTKILTLDEAENNATIHALSNENIGMGFDENDIHMNFGNGDLHVSSSADAVDMSRMNNRDVTLELGDGHTPEIADTPEQETEHDSQATTPNDAPANTTETSTEKRQDAPDNSRPEQDTKPPSTTTSNGQSTETNPSVTNGSDAPETTASTGPDTNEEEHGTDWDEEPASTTGTPDTTQTNDTLPNWDEEPASTTGPPDADQSSNGLPDWDEEPASSTDNHETENEGQETTNDGHDRDTSNDDWADGGLN